MVVVVAVLVVNLIFFLDLDLFWGANGGGERGYIVRSWKVAIVYLANLHVFYAKVFQLLANLK